MLAAIQYGCHLGTGWTISTPNFYDSRMVIGGKDTREWRCRVCGFERYFGVSVVKHSGVRYYTSFYSCRGCSMMFTNPEQFNAIGQCNPNVEAPPDVVIPMRRQRI